jgi:hypothetical protein
VKTPDNKVASTELSGCVPLAEHLLAIGNQKKQSTLTKDETISEDNEGTVIFILSPPPLQLCHVAAVDNLRKGNWSSRLKDLLPGEKFEESRAEIRQILGKVETILDESMKGVNLFRYKCHIYLYYKRQCQAYQHLIQEGITTEKGDKHMNEYEHWKELVNQEIEKMFGELIEIVFVKG